MKEKISKITHHTWAFRAAKFGYITRGIIYFFVGLLGLQFAFGVRESGGSFTDAIVLISQQNFGSFFLVIIILGLSSYAIWGFLRGIFNVLEKEDNVSGFLTRVGYLSSAFSYAILAFVALLILRGLKVLSQGGENSQLSAAVLNIPFGRELLVLIGLCWLVSGVIQGVEALKAKFKDSWNISKVNQKEKHWPVLIGKVGIFSRAIIFTMVGYFIIQAAIDLDPEDAYGTGEVLEFLSELTLGPVIVGLLSIGILCFGVFSILSAWFLKDPKK